MGEKKRHNRETRFSPNCSQLEEKGINIEGEKLSDVRSADDVALTAAGVKDTEHQLNTVDKERLKTGLKIHQGKTTFMTNIDTTDNIQIYGAKVKKENYYTYLGQTIAMEKRTRQEVSIRTKAESSVFQQYREIFLNGHLTMSLKRRVFNQCVLPAMTYSCQARSLTKALVKQLETSQRAKKGKWKMSS